MGLSKVPRDYQIAALESLYDYFKTKTGNPVIALPTGTGKALVIAMFLMSVLRQWASQRILVLTHVKELVAQNFAELKEAWPEAPAGIFSAGLGKKETFYPITFAGIASIVKMLHLFGRIDLIVIDEAHLVNPTEETMYKSLIEELMKRNLHLKVIGLTATPYRLGHGKITEDGIFTDICFDLTGMKAFNWLLQEGYLAPLIPKPTRAVVDTEGVGLVGGEFNQSKLQLAVNRDDVTEAALRECLERGHDRQHWLIFASGIEHAHNIAAMLNTMGVDTLCIHSNTKAFPMSDAQRDANIKAFKEGKVRAVVNNNVLTTGFNFPAIDMIVMLRPTMSTVLWVQMLGRGTRPLYAPGFDTTNTEGRLAAIAASPKQDCLVLDFARNSRRLGPINDPVVPRKKGEGAGEAPIKECPSCETYIHASLKTCCVCGHEFHFQHKLDQVAGSDELIKADLPIVEVFPVDHMTYSLHRKVGAAEMLRVAYYCGVSKAFYDYVCVEHEGFAKRKAKQWWAQHAREGVEMPATAAEAINISDQLRPVTHLRVWVNKKYPEIMAYCYDGTAFGTQLDDGRMVSVDAPGYEPPRAPAPPLSTAEKAAATKAGFDVWDDDIPF